jgi:hypothetical protein
MVTGRAEDIASKYRFPFGCPVIITKTDGRDWAYDTINAFGIALGAVKSSNGSTLVLIQGRGNVPLPRLHVQPLLLEPPEGATTTVLELEKLGPIEGKDGSLEFFSAAAPIDLVEQITTGLKPGTLGMSMFGVSDRATRSKTLHERTFATCAYTQQDGRQRHHAFSATRITRTDANPTLGSVLKDTALRSTWQPAIDKELKMLSDLDVYDSVRRSDVKAGCQILNLKMDLKTKFLANGLVDKLKARLVVLGMLERREVGENNYSPTANVQTVNLIFALAAQHNLHIKGIDIFGAFVTAPIGADAQGDDAHVYVQLPNGLVPNTEDGHPPIWKLKRALYGLRRSPQLFYKAIAAFLLKNGYERSPLDNCLFHKIDATTGEKIFFCTHVDDFAIAATNPELIEELCAMHP